MDGGNHGDVQGDVQGGIRTTCPYCGVGCGVIARQSSKGWSVAGDPDHPANWGRLCSKGIALGETLRLDTRLLYPEIEGRRVSWGTAVAETAGALSAAIEQHGPDSVAFYVSGQLLTEDYYVANKLMKGFIGAANIDTNSRLCMASSVAGHKRAFGSDTVPGTYEDLELADLVVLAGSNLAWCHPVLFQRLRKAKAERGTKVVVIDPRRTATCDIADLHLALAPGTDVALFNGLLLHLMQAEAIDPLFAAVHTEGLIQAIAAARQDARDSAATAEICGLEAKDVALFFDWVAQTPRTVTVYSQGINQSSAGTDKVNAIVNTHLATGRIGLPGAGPFSITGQPNAMGGREVGGLANQLAAHMGFDPESIDRVRRFWNAPRVATTEGLKAVDLFKAVDDGRIKVLWVMATNPAVSLPDADLVRRALKKCPTVIVSDCVADTDTMRYAHIRLPALGWGEKAGTVTNSDRTISRQRGFLDAPGEARADWWIMAKVAAAMGWGGNFAYDNPAAIFAEHAALSGFENNGSRAFDIGALAAITQAEYDILAPAPWPRRVGQREPIRRLFGNGHFHTPDAKARILAVSLRLPRERTDQDFPFILNTGRARDQWHTMTRTGLSPRLMGHRPEPWLDVHPEDAAQLGFVEDHLVRVASRLGDYVARLRFEPGQRRGEVFLAMHWNDCFAANSVVGRLIPPYVDPVSGQPEAKHVAVRLSPFAPLWQGLLAARALPDLDGVSYWARQPGEGISFAVLAGESGEEANRLIARLDEKHGPHRVDYRDEGRGIVRVAWLAEDRLEAALFLGPEPPAMPRDWLEDLARQNDLAASDCHGLLAGRPASPHPDKGRIVCSCFQVGLTSILDGIRHRGWISVADIGQALQAGTGCGSCRSELVEIINRVLP